MNVLQTLQRVLLLSTTAPFGLHGLAPTCPAPTGPWTDVADMPTARLGLATAVVDDKLFAIGGYAVANAPGLGAVEHYDPLTGAWTARASMPTGRRWLSASAVDGVVYAMGGFENFGTPALSIVEAYEVATDTWSTVAPMLTARKGFSTAVVDGMIYAIGGASASNQRLASVEVYDPATDTWTTRTSMPGARWGFSTGVIDGDIYAAGGSTYPGPPHPGLTTVQVYSPALDTPIADDYNGNCLVEQGDLNLVLLNWGKPPRLLPDTWIYDAPLRRVGQEILNKVLLNWGKQATPLAVGRVPEPDGLSLLLLMGLSILLMPVLRTPLACRRSSPLVRASVGRPSSLAMQACASVSVSRP